MKAHKCYAPNVAAFSAHIVNKNTPKKAIHVGNKVTIYRDKAVLADGVFVPKGHAFIMSAAGCPIIIATGGDRMIVAHAGRDSLIDRGAVMGNPSRVRMSVVDSIVEAFRKRGVPARRVSMRMILSIPTRMFKHKFRDNGHGEFNQALCELVANKWPSGVILHGKSGLIDLENIFLEQAAQLGISDVQASHSLDEFPALAHTRDGKGHSRRNLIIIRHCPDERCL
jgi:hypothetical protein